jgi:amidase
MSPAWRTDYVLGDHFVGGGGSIAAVAATPSLTIPIGETHGLPLGLAFMGRAYSEGELIGFGYALEQLTRARKPPMFKPTLVP